MEKEASKSGINKAPPTRSKESNSKLGNNLSTQNKSQSSREEVKLKNDINSK